MKLRNNSNLLKIYTKPELREIPVDKDIILMGESGIGNPTSGAPEQLPGPDFKEAAPFEKSLPSNTQNPFGGSRPEY